MDQINIRSAEERIRIPGYDVIATEGDLFGMKCTLIAVSPESFAPLLDPIEVCLDQPGLLLKAKRLRHPGDDVAPVACLLY